jgi:hypothetical protein
MLFLDEDGGCVGYTHIHTEIAPKGAPTQSQQEAHGAHTGTQRSKTGLIGYTSRCLCLDTVYHCGRTSLTGFPDHGDPPL